VRERGVELRLVSAINAVNSRQKRLIGENIVRRFGAEQDPKQLLALTGEGTLMQATARRLDQSLSAPGRHVLPPILVANENYRFITAQQLCITCRFRQAGNLRRSPHPCRDRIRLHQGGGATQGSSCLELVTNQHS